MCVCMYVHAIYTIPQYDFSPSTPCPTAFPRGSSLGRPNRA